MLFEFFGRAHETDVFLPQYLMPALAFVICPISNVFGTLLSG
jgi:hypothetical protein